MQFYDLVMLAVMGGSILFGLWKGLAWQVASISAILVSYLVARNFNEPVANMIGGDPSWNRFLAMLILFLGSSLLIWIAFGFVRSSIEKMHLKGFDRQAGALAGAGKGFVLCTLITLFAVSLLGETVCKSICTSRSGNYIARVLGHMGGLVPSELGKHINPYIDKFQAEIDEHRNDPEHAIPSTGSHPANEFIPSGNRFQPGQPNMTQGSAPSERVGHLQPVQGNGNFRQPAYTGSWEPPVNTDTTNRDLQLPDINVNLPPVDWRRAAGDILDRTFGSDR